MREKIIIFLKPLLMPLQLVRINLRSLIGFELICRLLCALVFFPLLTWMQRLFLIFNASRSITARNLSSFLRNPLTWVVLIIQALLMTTFALFERFALVDALQASQHGIKLSVRQIFHNGFDHIVQRFRPANWFFIPYTLFILHFGMPGGDLSSVTSFLRIPGFILEEFEKQPWKKALYYAAIIILTYLFLRWVFSIPAMLEEDAPKIMPSLKKSWSMTKGIYFLIVLINTFIWVMIVALVTFLTCVLIVVVWYLLSLWLLPGSTGSIVSFFSSRMMPVYIIAYIGFSWLNAPTLLACHQALYYYRKKKLEEPVLPYTEERDFIRSIPLVHFLAVAVIGICVFFSGPRVFAQARWMLNTHYGLPLIMAHRGFSAAAPENTIPAFQKAVDTGCTAAELDVQMTKDGEIIVLHDSNLKRTTGLNKNVWEVTYDEIKDLDAGSRFSKEYAGTKIPTLAEVLQRFGKDLFLNIEIKRNGHDDGIVQRTIDVITEYGNLDNCDITSQNYETIEEVKRINPDILTAYTSIIGLGEIHMLEAADIISIQETFANYANIEKLQNAGKRVFVWTVNESDTIKKLIALNVNAILTNDPILCKSITDEYSNDTMNLIRRIQNVFIYM